MTYSCQNRRLLKAQRKNEKRRKGTERVHFSSSSLAPALWHEGFFGWWFGFLFFWWLNNLGCSSRWVHDKLQKHGCFLSQTQFLYCKFVHDCFGVDYWVMYIGFVALTAFEKESYVITDSAGKCSVLHEEDLVDLIQSLRLAWVQVCERTCRTKKIFF